MTKFPKSPIVQVEVTNPLIERAVIGDSGHCMIAEALRDARPDAASISVDLQTIRFSLPERRLRYTYLTPRIAQLALVRFDQGASVKPFSFVLKSGHVTRMFHREPLRTPRSRTEKATAATEKMRQFLPGVAASAKDPLLKEVIRGASAGSVNERIGGRTPPRAALASGRGTTPFAKRREFGLRALGNKSA